MRIWRLNADQFVLAAIDLLMDVQYIEYMQHVTYEYNGIMRPAGYD